MEGKTTPPSPPFVALPEIFFFGEFWSLSQCEWRAGSSPPTERTASRPLREKSSGRRALMRPRFAELSKKSYFCAHFEFFSLRNRLLFFGKLPQLFDSNARRRSRKWSRSKLLPFARSGLAISARPYLVSVAAFTKVLLSPFRTHVFRKVLAFSLLAAFRVISGGYFESFLWP